MNRLSEKIANFIADSDYKDLPLQTIEGGKKAILDWFAVTIAGANEPPALIISEYVREIGASEQASVILKGFKTSPDMAAWVNGISSHALDYDDTFPAETGWNFHPSVPVLPAVISLAEQLHASGEKALISYAVGIQLEYWIGNLIGRKNTDLGWHTLSTLGTLGSIAASSKMLGLNAHEIANALGIGSAFAGGLRSNLGTMSKSLQAGNAARSGIIAASLAKRGFTGKETVIEERLGFLDIFSGGTANRVDIQQLQEDWAVVRPGIAFKPYPCCRATHTSIDASLQLKAEHHFETNEVAKIVCKTSRFNRQFARYDNPKSALEKKFSIPYCIAVALTNKRVVLEDFYEQAHNPQLAELAALVEVLDSERMDHTGALDLSSQIEINLKNGTKYTCRINSPRGEPENPLSIDDLSAKLYDCASGYLHTQEIEQLHDAIMNLESIPDASVLAEITARRS